MIQIPDWNVYGVLPPADLANPTATRAPYRVPLASVIHRFATTAERVEILKGFLDYRAALHAAGLKTGFQWLDGSLLEKVEWLEGRAPRDIDVVTFYELPAGVTQADVFDVAPKLFDHAHVKAMYRTDSYYQSLQATPAQIVDRSAYWYSMWAHRRTHLWKGFLQVDLDPAEDEDALVSLTAATLTLAGQVGAALP